MHIQDNMLPSAVSIGGYVVAGAATACVLARMKESDVPRVAVLTSLFFAVSLIHVPIGVGSVHPVLNGLVGIVLGWLSVPAILIALGFQLIFFFHGGITTLGINTVNLAAGALAAHYVFASRRLTPWSKNARGVAAVGFVAGAAAVLVSALLYFACLLSRADLQEAAKYALLLQLPVMAVEAVITAFAVAFLGVVKPGLLERRGA